MEDLKTVSRVEFVDETNYDKDLRKYVEWTTFDKLEGGKEWEVSYHSSSEAYCCPCCGEYEDHRSETGDGTYTCSVNGMLDRISTEDLIEEIRYIEENGWDQLYVLYKS